MQLPTQSGWDSTASTYEKNFRHSQSHNSLCHGMKMSEILYHNKEKSDTFHQPCEVSFAYSFAITSAFWMQTKYNLSEKGIEV